MKKIYLVAKDVDYLFSAVVPNEESASYLIELYKNLEVVSHREYLIHRLAYKVRKTRERVAKLWR